MIYVILIVLFVGSLFVQFGYYGIVFSRLFAEKVNDIGKDLKIEHFVSVIVCAHNEYENLGELIPQLLNQNYSKFEVIIVNDRSEDGTEQLLQNWQKQDNRLNFISIREKHKNFNSKKYALTQGIHQAKGEIILLTDADCRPISSDWIDLMQSKMQEGKDICLGYSPYMRQKGLLNAFIQYETLYTAIQYFSLALWGLAYMGVGRNLAYRKSVFINKGGFKGKGIEDITGGDDDLWINRVANRHNVAVQMHKHSYMYSIPKTNWRAWIKQKMRHLSVGKHYTWIPKLVLGGLTISLVVFWGSFVVIEVLFAQKNYNLLIIAGFLLRIITIASFFTAISRKLQGQLHTILIPIFDFLFVFYIFIIGTLAISIKKIQWE